MPKLEQADPAAIESCTVALNGPAWVVP